MKEEILQQINEAKNPPSGGRNSMGVSENYYNPYFLIGKCFTEEELSAMGEDSLVNMVKLANFASHAFY